MQEKIIVCRINAVKVTVWVKRWELRMRLGIIINPDKYEAKDVARDIKKWAQEAGVELCSPQEMRICLQELPVLLEANNEEALDCVLVLGGDGTLLNAARKLAPKGIPVLGVNLGNLGFLTGIELSELQAGLDSLARGEVYYEERMMLEAEVMRDDSSINKFYALNDMVISKGAFSRMIRLKMSVSGQYVETFPADGLIVSSPTGSTAYCLSAGGPIVSPELEAMILTPICPHNLYSRPLVISPTEEIRISMVTQGVEAMLTVDGQHGIQLRNEDAVVVRKAPFYARLVRLEGQNFFAVLRKKMQEVSPSDELI